ncbi:MAG: hypothetical protein QOE26_3166 [Verrucomicrobiota bacterium]
MFGASLELGIWSFLQSYFFGEAETEGAALAFGEAAGVVAGATETAADGAGLVVTGEEVVAAEDGAGLAVAVPVTAELGETEAPGTGVADMAGTGVGSASIRLLKLLVEVALWA